jgi:23S rRNA pseudouridine2605 synthase
MEKKNFEFGKKVNSEDSSEKRARRGSEEKTPRERRPRKDEPGADRPYTAKKFAPAEYTPKKDGKDFDFKDKKSDRSDADRPKRSYERKGSDSSYEKSSGKSDSPKVFREKKIAGKSDYSKSETPREYGDKKKEWNKDERPRKFDGPKEYGDKPAYGDKKKEWNKDERPRKFDGPKEYGDKPAYGDRKKVWNKDERPRKFDGPKESGDKPAYGDRKKEWNKDERPRKFDGPKEYGDKPSFSDRKKEWNPEEKPSYGEKRPYVKREYSGKGPTTGHNEDKRKRDWDKPTTNDKGKTAWNENPNAEFVDKPYSKDRDFKKGKNIKQDWEKPLESPEYAKRSSPKIFRDKKVKKQTLEDVDGKIRLNKYIANAGICSRREADDLIKSGAVKVNGVIISELGFRISPMDKVQYGGETLSKEVKRYVLLNKPKDYITTSNDPEGRKTVMELVKNACKERLYPVGRLDRATTGLLLMTNDGELAKKLTHPSHQVKKIYHVSLDKSLKAVDLKKITEGIMLEDGLTEVDEIAYVGEGKDKTEIGIALHSGKNRIVRRIFEHLGYEVVKLDRTFFAGLTKKDLPRGNYRLLTEKEIINLRMT